MSDSQLEKHIKNKVDGHISPIDAEALWTDIQQKQKEPVPYWSMFGALALLILLGSGLAFYQIEDLGNKQNLNTTKTIIENTPSFNSENKCTNKTDAEELKDQINQKEQTFTKNPTDPNKRSNVLEIKNQITEEDRIAYKTIDKALNEDLGVISKIAANHMETKEATKIKEIRNDNKHKKYKQNFIAQTKNEATQKIEPNIPRKVNNQTILSLKNNGTIVENTIEPKSKNDIFLSATDKDFEKRTNIVKEANEYKGNSKTIHLLKKRSIVLFNDRNQQLSVLKQCINPLHQKMPLFELGAYTNYEYAFRQFTKATVNDSIFNLNDSLIQAYIKARNDSETFVESFRVGLFLQKTFNPGFRITAGLEYAQLTERFNTELNLGQFSVISELDSSKFTIVERRNIKEIYNRYETVNVPVLIGKNFKTKKWSFWYNLGIAFNLKFYYSGQIHSNKNKEDVLHLSNQEPSIFKDKAGLSYLANFGLTYAFNKDFSIEFGPHFQSTFKTINRNYRLDTKYHYLGIRVSLAKQF